MTGQQRSFIIAVTQRATEVFPDLRVSNDGWFIRFHRIRASPDLSPIVWDLRNFFAEVQSNPQRADEIIQKYLGQVSELLSDNRGHEDSDYLRKNLFLAARPPGFVKGCPFEWAIVPELSLYFAIDHGERVGFLTETAAAILAASSSELMELAWNNTFAEESNPALEHCFNGQGLILKATGRFQTLAHLLYWPPALKAILLRSAPNLCSGAAIISAPTPGVIVVLSIEFLPAMKVIHGALLRQFGRLMSESIYLLENAQFSAKLLGAADGKVFAIALAEYGFGAADTREPPFRPTI
jgi:hypothetical protein